jgi:hypothetical protein
LVWKVILPLGTKDPYLGKWSPNWEGPYLVSQLFDGNAYKLMHVNGEEHIRSINGKYLKPYKPSFMKWLINIKSSEQVIRLKDSLKMIQRPKFRMYSEDRKRGKRLQLLKSSKKTSPTYQR